MNEQEIIKFIYEDLNYYSKTYIDYCGSGFKLANHEDWIINDKKLLREEAKKLNIKLIIRKNEIIASFYENNQK